MPSAAWLLSGYKASRQCRQSDIVAIPTQGAYATGNHNHKHIHKLPTDFLRQIGHGCHSQTDGPTGFPNLRAGAVQPGAGDLSLQCKTVLQLRGVILDSNQIYD
jgi:hypothetical protein